jgi:murein L,D-transpeptidase YcbB/YkuD
VVSFLSIHQIVSITSECVMPITSRLSSSYRLAAGLLVAFLASAGANSALARNVLPPPEPSMVPWVSQQAEAELARAVEMYRRLAASTRLEPLPNRITLRPGDSGAEVGILTQRLLATGDLRTKPRDPYAFDVTVQDAVKRYQLRNGVEPTGIVYGITQRLLNVPIETRLKQLELNLGRLRELNAKTTALPKYIVMNAASFELQGIARGRVEVTSRTIAGKRATPTPDVHASVQAVNTLPYWHVPGTIARAQLIPAIRKDPAYLMKEHIRVFSTFGGEEINPATINWFGDEANRYVFRQDFGPHNALGLLRFDMPNKHIVYMHDTPMKPLFNSYERAFSAGCVRLHNWLGVAEWLLNDQPQWNRTTLEGEIASGRPRTVKLTKPVPVFFTYLTAWVDNGVVHFRNDLYNRDNSAFDGGEDVSARSFAPSLAP